ncbi:hypothetical protein DOTSEDRAFT_24509 [Dothistroma septosporum NZE10]|uniref:Uncharacterized protein n=1 Tax=Dothistroma septosporum (strain NZE10 / CBS 128990) TaxID=675120 RepID=N1PM97_DOTSN|nr:hypothetical protein DOTSEDRAFT_24509 [Dothistroma septosporum NZE10]
MNDEESDESSDGDEEENDFVEVQKLWEADNTGTLISRKLVDRPLVSPDGTMLPYFARRNDHILKVQPKRGDVVNDDCANGILRWSKFSNNYEETELQAMSDDAYHEVYQDFQIDVLYACLPETQLYAAQELSASDILADALSKCLDRKVKTDAIKRAAGQFVIKMTSINPRLLDKLDEKSKNCCRGLKDALRFKEAALDLTMMPEFFRTITAVADGHINAPAPGMGVWPAEVVDGDAAARSLNSGPIIEKKLLMAPTHLPREVAIDNEWSEVSFQRIKVLMVFSNSIAAFCFGLVLEVRNHVSEFSNEHSELWRSGSGDRFPGRDDAHWRKSLARSCGKEWLAIVWYEGVFVALPSLWG